MDMKEGYRQTEGGIIPKDWSLRPLGTIGKWFSGGTPRMSVKAYWSGDIPWVSPKDMKVLRLHESIDHISTKAVADGARLLPAGAILVVVRGMILAHSFPVARAERTLAFNQDIKAVVTAETVHSFFLLYWLTANAQRLLALATESTHGTKRLPTEMLFRELVAYPPKPEQEAIAEALSDADALIESLEQLITKKRNLKQGAMQELLTGKKRLPGFSEEWQRKMLEEVTDCLDNLRVPLNEAQREKMRGDYPYCGANGVLDFVNGYVIDDDIILIAEDGGYFDEYAYRPIAYRMIGKCWVNNHAHILKSKSGFDQGFIFYSLVHKNVLSFLASGTRAKLNKSEMNKIEVALPSNEPEQTAIAAVLTDMDTEITALESKLTKARQLKQGMMHNLLTGRIRLV